MGLRSITTNKTSRDNGIPAELFQILKDDALKALHSICQKIWKTQQWPQDRKRSAFIPIPKKGNAKECSHHHTIALISHASKLMLKILQDRLQQYVIHEHVDVQAGFSKGRGNRSNCQHLFDHRKKQENSRKTSTSALLTMPKPLTVWTSTKWKILKEMGIPDHLTCLLRNLYPNQEATELDMEQLIGSKQGKEYVKAVYCHPAHLT